MRCPSCGTENAPDSRFCGGCGAKLSLSRTAPTAKIPDDAPYAPPTGQQAQVSYSPGPVSYGPASIPPPSGPASIPPTNNPSIPPVSIAPGSNPPASIPPTNNPSIPPSSGPASIPPTNNPAYGSRPPQDSLSRKPTPIPTPAPGSLRAPAFPPTQQRAQSPAPAMSSADQSFVAPPHRPLGLIAVILIADLALAGTGAVLLAKGLSAKKATVEQKAAPAPAPTPEPPKPAQKADVTPIEPAPTQVAAADPPAAQPADTNIAATVAQPTAAASVTTPSKAEAKSDAKTEAKTDKSATRAKAKSSTASSAKTTAGPVTSPSALDPQDPYGDAKPAAVLDVVSEEAKNAAKSKGAIDRCIGDAAPVHGMVQVAYQINADGTVGHPYAVGNTTGNDALGQCLAKAVASWRFTPHAGDSLNEVHPFNFQ